ncbi:MAG: glycosyltransferase [Candidatus Bathyarchaeota archaeon]|nr:glycosyltransferase [Candidatus Bathyarchaeota archaeon]MCZ2809622.1 glycosyltransferase [Candidatus Bathyarchaeota archaeon]
MISWIIAAYNEEERLPKTLGRVIDELNTMDFEIIVSDDGSKDGTCDVASTYANILDNVRIVTNTHKGLGSALRHGFNTSRGDVTVFSSADIWLPRDQVEKLTMLLDDFDLILLSKHTHGSIGFNVGTTRKFLSLSFNFLVRLLWKLPYRDTQGLKICKVTALKEIISQAKSDGFLFGLEIVVYAHKMNRKIVELPWAYSYSAGSKVNLRSILQMIWGLLFLKVRSLGMWGQ